MEYIKSKDTFLLMRDILKILYPKLMKHGSRVAYMVYTMLREEDKYEEFELADMVMAATLHDIGAYRTESERLGGYPALRDEGIHGTFHLRVSCAEISVTDPGAGEGDHVPSYGLQPAAESEL